MHRIEPSVSFDKMMQDIEECVGSPEVETPEERQKRQEWHDQIEQRRKRKQQQ